MSDIDHDLREMFRRHEADLAGSVVAPPGIAGRVHRRQGITVLTATLSVAAVVWGIVVGLASIDRADPTVPADPTIQGYHNGQITFQTEGEGRAVIQIDPATGRVVELPIESFSGSDLAWSPDGMSLAYALDGMRILDVSSGESRQIMACGKFAHACTFEWSPDGSTIAVAQDDQIELVSADGSSSTSLTPVGLDVGTDETVRDPTWSPDGRRIAFVVPGYGPEEPDRLYAVDTSGSGLRLLVEEPPGYRIGVQTPEWSPDGSKIAYIASGEWSNDTWRINVTVIEADGSNPTEVLQAGRCFCLGFSPGLAWSPDGTQLAAVIPAPGRGKGPERDGLYVVDADGTGLRLLREGALGRPAWRPVP